MRRPGPIRRRPPRLRTSSSHSSPHSRSDTAAVARSGCATTTSTSHSSPSATTRSGIAAILTCRGGTARRLRPNTRRPTRRRGRPSIASTRERALVSLDQGGLSYATFVREMVASRPELAGQIDGAFVLAATSSSEPAVQRVVAVVRSELDETENRHAPIQVGFGWYTSGPGAMPEAERASFYNLVANRLARSDCGVDGLLAKSWVTPQTDLPVPAAWYGMVDPQSFELGPTATAYRDVARTFLGYGPDPAPRAVVHTCFRASPDTDGDGVPDAAESYPLDPQRAVAENQPPPAPTITSAPDRWTRSLAADFDYS